METTLLYFIFNIAPSLLPHLVQHFRQDPLQRVVLYHPAFFTWRLHGLVPVVTDIEGCAIQMTGILCGIPVVVAQLSHILLGAQDTRDDELMERDALDLQTVIISPADIIQENGSAGNEIGNASVEHIYMIIRRGCHIDQFFLP